MNLVKKIKMGVERFNMDFDTSNLTAYADENSNKLWHRAVTTGRTVSLVNIQEDVKGTAKIKLVNDSITYQAADDCSMSSDSNSTIFTDKNIVTVKQGFYKTFCQDDLSGFWTRLALKGGAAEENETLIFEEELTNYIMELHMYKFEQLIWTGDSSGSDLISGWATQMDADAAMSNANSAGLTSMTSSNSYSAFLALARAIPSTIYDKDDVVIFCGREYFNFLKDDLFNQNLYHVPVANQEDNEMILPATGIKVVQVSGLNGHTGMYAGRRSDFILGTSLQKDIDGSFEMWYDVDSDLIKIRCKFYAGVSYPFSNQIVKWTPAAS